MDVPLDEKGKADFTQVLIGMMKKARIKKQIFGVKNYKFFQIFNEIQTPKRLNFDHRLKPLFVQVLNAIQLKKRIL